MKIQSSYTRIIKKIVIKVSCKKLSKLISQAILNYFCNLHFGNFIKLNKSRNNKKIYFKVLNN